MKNIIITMILISLFAVIIDFVSAQTTKNIIEKQEFEELIYTQKEIVTIDEIEPVIVTKNVLAGDIKPVIQKAKIVTNPIDEDILTMKEKIEKLEELKELRKLEKSMKIILSEGDNLNLDFIKSLQGTSFKELPMYIGENEDFVIDSIIKDNVQFQYIEYFGERYYQMDQKHRLIREYIKESTGEVWGDNGMLLGNLWCNFEKDCYRTGLFEGHYGAIYRETEFSPSEYREYYNLD